MSMVVTAVTPCGARSLPKQVMEGTLREVQVAGMERGMANEDERRCGSFCGMSHLKCTRYSEPSANPGTKENLAPRVQCTVGTRLANHGTKLISKLILFRRETLTHFTRWLYR